jgi:phage baseplate assembly protein W
MALSPLNSSAPRTQVIETTVLPSRTYEFDFTTGEFTGRMIDEETAIRQFIMKAIYTPRFRHIIYTYRYGCEVDSLIAESLPYDMVVMEVERMIREALIYDERISTVTDFSFSQKADKLYVAFTVTTNTGIAYREEANFDV